MWSQNCESCAYLLQLVQEQLQLYELGEERKKERKKALTSFGRSATSAASARVRKVLRSAQGCPLLLRICVRVAQVVVNGVVVDPVLGGSLPCSISAEVGELFCSQCH